MENLESFLEVKSIELFDIKDRLNLKHWNSDLVSSRLSIVALSFLILAILATCTIDIFLDPNSSSGNYLLLTFQFLLFSSIFYYLFSEYFTEHYRDISEILKNLVINKIIEEKQIFIYGPTRGYFQFGTINPKKYIFCLSNTENISPKIGEKHYIILNSIKLKSNNVDTTLRPYTDAIVCNHILDNQSIWRYFMTFFFVTNIIYGIFIFVILMLTSPILESLNSIGIKILFFGLYITLLTVFFAKIIWKFIHNIHLQRCKNGIREERIDNLKISSVDSSKQYFSQSLILLKQHGRTKIINGEKLLKKTKKTNKKLTERITSIIQIAAPLFYLAYITISISILKISF